MGPLAELLATDQRQALEFFVVGLRDVSEAPVDRKELLYSASILAHYAQTSTQTPSGLTTPAHLGQVFDSFVLDPGPRDDGALMESAGTQCLLLGGFFEGQMRRRHNIRWYAELGSGFFRRAALLESFRPKAELLDMMGRHFEPWRQRYARLSRDLRDRPYLMPRAI